MYNKIITRLKPVIIIFMLAAIMIIKSASASPVFKIKGATLISYNGRAESVTVPKKIKYIGKGAFSENNVIKKVIVREGTISIQEKAFKKCINLKKVKVPDTVTYISSNAFSGCKNIIIYAQKGSYALKFAKKHKIRHEIIKNTNSNGNNSDVKIPDYNITGMECYWYTAGIFPNIAQKKTITDKKSFGKLYELLLSLNSGETLPEDEIMNDGGQVLRVVIHFSDKEDLIIECNPVVYIQNGSIYKTSNKITPGMFWEQAEGEITETEL